MASKSEKSFIELVLETERAIAEATIQTGNRLNSQVDANGSDRPIASFGDIYLGRIKVHTPITPSEMDPLQLKDRKISVNETSVTTRQGRVQVGTNIIDASSQYVAVNVGFKEQTSHGELDHSVTITNRGNVDFDQIGQVTKPRRFRRGGISYPYGLRGRGLSGREKAAVRAVTGIEGALFVAEVIDKAHPSPRVARISTDRLQELQADWQACMPNIVVPSQIAMLRKGK